MRDPQQVRHGVLVAGRLADLGGEIDRLTHLNLDFPTHRVTLCVIVERLERGAPARMGPTGFTWATVHPTAYARLGPVDLDARRTAWLEVHRVAREARAPV